MMNSHHFPAVSFLALLFMAMPELRAQEEADGARSESFIPRRQPIDRYQEGWEFSPFMVKTNVVAKGPNFADDLNIAGISIIRGEAYVTLVNAKTKDYMRLEKDKEVDGLKLLEVNYDRDPKKASVKVASGDEQASIRYSDDIFKARPVGTPQNQVAQQGARQPAGVQRINQPGRNNTGRSMPSLASPNPQQVQRPGASNAPPNTGPPVPAPSRRRKIILPSAVQKSPHQ